MQYLQIDLVELNSTSSAICFPNCIDFHGLYKLGILAFETPATGVMKQQALAKLGYGPDLKQNQTSSTLPYNDGTLEVVPAQVWPGLT